MVDENSVVDRNSIKLVDESSVVVENTGLKLEEVDEKTVVYQSVFSLFSRQILTDSQDFVFFLIL